MCHIGDQLSNVLVIPYHSTSKSPQSLHAASKPYYKSFQDLITLRQSCQSLYILTHFGVLQIYSRTFLSIMVQQKFKVGDITKTFKNVFVSSKLSTSLILVGQLIENNCGVNFSRNSCLVHDQVLGIITVKGPMENYFLYTFLFLVFYLLLLPLNEV